MPLAINPLFSQLRFGVLVLAVQLVIIILFVIFVQYGEQANKDSDAFFNKSHAAYDDVPNYYAMFQDVHVMTFIGFGMLMTFLKRYGYSAFGLNLLIAAIAYEWGTLCYLVAEHVGKGETGALKISMSTLFNADFTACTVLISFGALLGKTTPTQLLILTLVEVVLAKVNEYVDIQVLQATDVGGSMVIHTFGAYFGLAAALVLYNKKVHEAKNEGSNYVSDIFSLVGTVFLFMYWPSFNAVPVLGAQRGRALINTYFSLASSVVVVFAISSALGKKGKLDMVHVQNATLAGGVAMGTCADMLLQPWVALVIGALAGTVSILGYKFITPKLNKFVHDTCGVNNLHGMPGIIGALAGVLFAGVATYDYYGRSLYLNFPARAPTNASLVANLAEVSVGKGRSAAAQAGIQAAALGITLAISISGGIATGFLLRIPIWGAVREPADLFEDAAVWELPLGADPEVGGADWHQLAVLRVGGSGSTAGDKTAIDGEKAAPDGEKARLEANA